MSLKNFLKHGVVSIALNAKGNPTEIPKEYCLGIAGKDYPAQTPRLWNAVFEQFGMKRRNIRLIANPGDVIYIFQELFLDPSYYGGDVGVGFKNIAGKYLSRLDPLAEAMGAINVVAREHNALVGYNTDGEGFASSLEEILTKKVKGLKGERVMLLGAGGTTNAIAFALAKQGCSLIILNRTVVKAQELAERLNKFFEDEVAEFGGRNLIGLKAPECGVIVSAIDDPHSPLDQYSALGPISLPATPDDIAANMEEATRIIATLPKDTVICDVMLRKEETATLRSAREAGLTTIDGMPMVLAQAIEAFWLVNRPELEADNHTKAEVAEIMRTTLQ